MDVLKKEHTGGSREVVVALAGNPNVGKSTVFNALTGMRQHTGNWPGKTVAVASGNFTYNDQRYKLVDLPGTYSLLARSEEEAVASDFLCSADMDAVIVVADATCLERNLNLVLQIREITDRIVLCVNLYDEAKRKKISINTQKLSRLLGNIPVVLTSAAKKKGLDQLQQAVEKVASGYHGEPFKIQYNDMVEQAMAVFGDIPRNRAVRILLGKEQDQRRNEAMEVLEQAEAFQDDISDMIAISIVLRCEDIARQVIRHEKQDYDARDRKWDKIFTGKLTGVPIMLLLLGLIFYITIVGANYPSEFLSGVLFGWEGPIRQFLLWIGLPEVLCAVLVDGMYRTLAWVVSVMLPPMAIFFPMFTLLEDLGYLPRVAFNLDHTFKKCGTCGKQALTMAMGFGCNAVGVTGCRIIDSPRERLVAMLTNVFVPCNGRFPLIFTMAAITIILFGASGENTVLSALIVTLMVLVGIATTFLVSKLLVKTCLKGMPSSFILEMPPYRKPQVLKVIVRSVFDRTIFILWRAVKVAAPAGLVIWLLANLSVGGNTLLSYIVGFLNPLGKLMGMDGSILTGFVLGMPANEIVLAVTMMCYSAGGSLTEVAGIGQLAPLFASLGWTPITAINIMIFSLLHFPCMTTLLTIRKESGSAKWTAVAFLLPTVLGILVCMATNLLYHIIF